MVRARNKRQQDRQDDGDAPSRRKSERRWLRTVRVKSRSLSVTSRTMPSPTGAAAEKTGVRSGALRDLGRRLPVACACERLGPGLRAGRSAGSTKSSSGLAPTIALNPRSSARAASLFHFWVVGSRSAIGRAGQLASCRCEARRPAP